MKKTIPVVAIATVLCACILAGCSSNQATRQPSASVQSPSVEVSANSNTSSNYDTVISLRTEGYQHLSVKDFNAAVKAKIEGDKDFLSIFNDFMGDLIFTPEDADYSFVCETLNFSVNEIISSQLNEPITFIRSLDKMDNGAEQKGPDGEIVYDYDFIFTAGYSVEYHINDDVNLTVGERDQLLSTYQTELQNAVGAMTNDELQTQDIRETLQSMTDDLAKRLSTADLTFENAKIDLIEIHDGGQEYQK